jgi:caffeoyl-CoA O-methyltransferase
MTETMKAIRLTPELYDYMLEKSLRESDVQRRLFEETAGLPESEMIASPDEAQFLALLVELIGAQRCIEVGVFTGYSTLAMALALPPEGRIVACDRNEETMAIARRYWAEAGVEGRIEVRLGDAGETLGRLLAEGGAGTFDLAFLDADKINYASLYEQLLALLRPRGLLVVDNVLWGGAVIDESDTDASTEAIRALNELVHRDQRVSLCMLPVADGLTLAMRR